MTETELSQVLEVCQCYQLHHRGAESTNLESLRFRGR